MHVAQALGGGKIKLARAYLTLTFYIHIFYFVPFCVILLLLKVPFSYTIPEEDRAPTIDAAWYSLALVFFITLQGIFAIYACFIIFRYLV